MAKVDTSTAHVKRAIACVPLIEPNAGADETMALMEALLAERDALSNVIKDHAEYLEDHDLHDASQNLVSLVHIAWVKSLP